VLCFIHSSLLELPLSLWLIDSPGRLAYSLSLCEPAQQSEPSFMLDKATPCGQWQQSEPGFMLIEATPGG